MSAPTLPPELLPWADGLGVFDIDLAVALGPVVRLLDSVLGARTDAAATSGERDGWGGLTRRGDPDRLLVSEWLLADEFPDEFLRRAVSSELLFLEPAFRDDTPQGRVVCLVDVGPDQLGAGRLLQLAALVVLVRRATALGTALRVGLAAGPTVTWCDGSFDVVAKAWLRGRSEAMPDPAAVLDHLDRVRESDGDAAGGRPDEVWVLCGPVLATHLRGRPRTVVSEPGDWDDNGLRTVRVRVEQRVVTVTLPPADIGIRALRGTGFSAAPGAVATGPSAGGTPGMRWPTFPSASRRVIARGADDRTLVSAFVDHPRPHRLKQHGFGTRVVAAATAGARLVVLLDRGAELEVQVVGRPLEGLHGLRVPNPIDGGDTVAGPLDRLVLVDRTLLWQHAGTAVWWLITPEGIAVADAVVAVGWSSDDGSPRVLRADAWPTTLPEAARDTRPLLLGPGRSVAWSSDGIVWRLAPAGVEIVLDEGETPLGLAVVTGRTGLVTRSASGQVVRFRSAGTARTFTRLSGAGGATRRVLHPTKPWLLVAREQGTYVVDLENDTVVRRLA